jgi:hypothetical protein
MSDPRTTRRIHRISQVARTERLSSPEVIQLGRAIRFPRGGIRRAFVKTTPSTGSTVDVYLDTDGTGDEVTVSCTFYDDSGEGGSFADTIRPNLTDGTPFIVYLDGDTWRNETPLLKGSAS